MADTPLVKLEPEEKHWIVENEQKYEVSIEEFQAATRLSWDKKLHYLKEFNDKENFVQIRIIAVLDKFYRPNLFLKWIKNNVHTHLPIKIMEALKRRTRLRNSTFNVKFLFDGINACPAIEDIIRVTENDTVDKLPNCLISQLTILSNKHRVYFEIVLDKTLF